MQIFPRHSIAVEIKTDEFGFAKEFLGCMISITV